MMSDSPTLCVCGEPADNRCSACKTVSYCSKECQRGDWKTHKAACKAATSAGSSFDVPSHASLRRGSPTDLQQLIRVGAQHSIYQSTMQLGLEPELICGATGAGFYEEQHGYGKFWRLDASVREEWETEAQVHHRKAQRFWKTYLSPITCVSHVLTISLTDPRKWVDIVLDARLPSDNQPMWQNQQNTALLDIFARDGPWYADKDCFRLSSGTMVLLAHGQPTTDLIDQVVRRCLSWTRPYEELDTLLYGVVLPLQKYWPDVVGTRILDLCFVMLSPGRPGPNAGRRVPGDRILEV
ncbi:hypothetical protein FB45DRAFT_932559 [Roridomyces roridus]|uniref:MYND-type domain-containing protein n=1 Tax=Roridomyces roridus TaxID=1738132 RepID=A0AAD7BDP0_9AGAR|nr:hypothetical protein FB45DRAFT_932559 [Roridomyces roridus]